eukprot:TRINITY_DN5779_c1_g1_i5.p1 TRINITY_DN5779_c1_g1~~TRINITY_DN5779_c1_g1_i5.p1  ORF type:complete len:755 (+),score=78.94 TRINITY_DN5779_c1_g1_i5:136-2400(+)
MGIKDPTREGFHRLSNVGNNAWMSKIDSMADEGEKLGLKRQVCMVFRYKTSKRVKYDDADNLDGKRLVEPGPAERNLMQMWKQRRENILKNLQAVGLDLYCYYSRYRDQILVKISADSEKLRATADRMKYRLQLKKQYLGAYAEYQHDIPGRPEHQNKDRRIVSHLYRVHSKAENPDPSHIFSPLDRINIVHHIITSVDRECAGVNVRKLIHQGELTAYFPLHDARLLSELLSNKAEWFKMGEEHAERMRAYFGDKICFYFLFLTYYLKWLAPLALIGLSLEVVDIFVGTSDNLTAIPWCIFVSVWCISMPYFWRRQEAKYAIQWGSLNQEDVFEPYRAAYHGEMLLNPATAQVEPHYADAKRFLTYAQNFAVMLIAGVAILLTMLFLILTRHHMKDHVADHIIAYQVFLAAYVEVSNSWLDRLAHFLTNRENHRTQSEHENSLIVKVILLQFLNSMFILYYTAFFKHHSSLFGVQMECLYDDCFLDLQSQLGAFVFFRLFIATAYEHYAPKIDLWWRSCSIDNMSLSTLIKSHGASLLTGAEISFTEQQSNEDKYSNFENYNEILQMHGFAAIFAVTSPWVGAVVFAFVCAEIWIDNGSILENRQRPLPYSAKNNEPWSTAFTLYGVIAATTNLLVLIFTSSQYETWSLSEKILFFLYLEHILFAYRAILQVIFPEVPTSVVIMDHAQETLVYRLWKNIKVEHHQDLSSFRKNAASNAIEVLDMDPLHTDEGGVDLNWNHVSRSVYNEFMDLL